MKSQVIGGKEAYTLALILLSTGEVILGFQFSIRPEEKMVLIVLLFHGVNRIPQILCPLTLARELLSCNQLTERGAN
jgi:hypothetical protein